MSWISDVKHELRHLHSSAKELRKFGFLVGFVFLLLAGFGYYRGWRTAEEIVFIAVGVLLLAGASFSPSSLRRPYLGWMTIAFALGWLISRLVLMILFYLVITPVGLIARLLGKEFIDTDFRKKKESYWITKPVSRKTNYGKMY